jgi:leucyl/phenylalanyl-tRNA--protein transferase
MPIYALTEEINFPPVECADENGILAVGGDLSTERLIKAYEQGIFPWFSEEDPILWWAPDPRFVIFPERLKISRSMRQILKRNQFEITYDRVAYCELHQQGLAHSVEAWQDKKLVGGLYGVSLGSSFFGESMFTRVSNASKVAFITMVSELQKHNFTLIDCQVYTGHLLSFGAEEIARAKFIKLLQESNNSDTLIGDWGKLLA